MKVQYQNIQKSILRQIECWNVIDDLIQSSKVRLTFASFESDNKIKVRRIYNSSSTQRKIDIFLLNNSVTYDNFDPELLSKHALDLLEAAEVDFTVIKPVLTKLELGNANFMIKGLLKCIWVAVALRFKRMDEAENVYWEILESIIRNDEKGKCDCLSNHVYENIEANCMNEHRVDNFPFVNRSFTDSVIDNDCMKVEFQDFGFCINFQELQPIKEIEKISFNDLGFEDLEDLLS